MRRGEDRGEVLGARDLGETLELLGRALGLPELSPLDVRLRCRSLPRFATSLAFSWLASTAWRRCLSPGMGGTARSTP